VDHFETIRQTKDGMRRHVSLTISPVRDAQGRTVGASKIARDITQRRKIEHMLKEAELSGRLLQLQDEERRRVARELHDGVGQLLAAMGMNVGTIAQERGKLGANAARCVEENAALVEQALTEIRTLSHLLHPPFLDEVGLVSALTEYVEGFGERSNIRVTVDLQAKQERLPHEYEMCLFRIVQECLTNIHRHSGSGTAQVRLLRVAGEIHLEVADQGRGISPEIQERFFAGKSTGVGLRGMRERVRQLGGALEIQSDGNGTSVFVMLPIRDEGSTVSGGEMLSSEKNGDGRVAQAGAQGRVKPARKTTLM
jgi:signal transduction histidine kinase